MTHKWMKYQDINDYEMLYMIHQGDEAALELLLSKYRNYIYSLIVDRWEPELPGFEQADLFQISQIKLVEACYNYNEFKGASFQTYLTMCLVRKLSSLKRSARREQFGFPKILSLDYYIKEGGGSYLSDLIQNKNQLFDPGFYAEYRDLLGKTQTFVDGLTSKERKIWMLMTGDISYEEASIILNISKKSYGNRVYRLKRKFNDYLKQSQFD